MKRTTYILIGILVSGLVVSVLGIIVVSMTATHRHGEGVSLKGEIVEMDMTGVHVVKAFYSECEATKSTYMVANGQLEIVPSSRVGKRVISYPKNKYLNVRRGNDTLFVEIDLKTYNFSEKENQRQSFNPLFVVDLDLRLSVDSTLKSVITDIRQMGVTVKNLKSDSLQVCANNQRVLLDSIQIRSFSITGGTGVDFQVMKSEIENLYISLDDVDSWTLKDSKVGTEFLSGHGRHYNNLQRGECRQVVWTPLSGDSELNVTLKEKTTLLIEP